MTTGIIYFFIKILPLGSFFKEGQKGITESKKYPEDINIGQICLKGSEDGEAIIDKINKALK